MPTFDAHALTTWAAGVLTGAGLPDGDARTVARSLVESNLRGHDSHGVMRLIQYVQFVRDGVYKLDAELLIERESAASVACDGQWGFGQIQAHRLIDLLAPKARELGVAAGTIRNCGHIGRLGEYAERAIADELILIASVNNDGAGQRVAPPGGVAPRLGTNPLCVGIPCGDEPIVLDFGTSVVAEGKVRNYYLDAKRPTPEGWLLDASGAPTCDPSVLYEPPLGSILPVGGPQAYKGFGLALVLDMLTGGLSGGHTSFAGSPPARGNCVFFVLLNPEQFAGCEPMRAAAATVTRFVRDTPRAAGCEAIVLPGDPERRMRATRIEQGIPIPQNVWDKLSHLGQTVGAKPIVPLKEGA